MRLGSSNREEGGEVFAVKNVIIHQKYSDGDYDLALLELQETMTFSKNIQPAALIKPEMKIRVGVKGLMTAWGYTSTNEYGTPFPVELKGANITMLDAASCESVYEEFKADRMLCAGGTTQTACVVNILSKTCENSN